MSRVLAQKLASETRSDPLTIVYMGHLSDIFVSMLHHQLCVVLRKATDPKHSTTIARTTARLDWNASINMVCLLVFDMSNTYTNSLYNS